MPKLDKAHAKQVKEAESGFKLPEPGIYHVRLRDVDGSGNGPKGPYWTWEYEIVGDAEGPCEFDGSRLWNNTSLSEKAAGIFQQTWNAFGVDPDTDTDDLLGSIVQAQVGIRTIQPPSPRAGERTSQIERLLPADPEFQIEGSGVGDAEKGEAIF